MATYACVFFAAFMAEPNSEENSALPMSGVYSAGSLELDLCYLRLSHFCRVPLVMKEDESLDPTDIGFLRHVAIMPGADRLADLVEESGFLRGWWQMTNCGFRRSSILS